MQILPFEPTFGQSIGQSLSEGLQTLAQGQMQHIQNRHVTKYLQSAFPNMSKEQADLLGKLPPDYRNEAIKTMQQQQANMSIGQYLNSLAGNTQQPQQYQQQTPSTSGMQNIQALKQQPQQPPQVQAPGQQTVQAQPTMQAAAQKQATMQQQSQNPAQIPSQMPQQQAAMPQIDLRNVPVGTQLQLANLGIKSKSEQRKAQEFERKMELQERAMGARERMAGAREATVEVQKGKLEETKKGTEIKKSAEQRQKDQELWKYNEKYIADVDNRAAMADEMEKSLTTIESALDAGNLPSPTLFKAQQLFGADIGDFLSDNAQVVIKASETMKNTMLKEYAGMGKILESEFKSLSNRVPTLLNDEAGARKLIALIRKQYQTGKNEFELKNKIIDQNNGTPPRNLKAQILNSPEIKAEKKDVLTDIKRIVHDNPNGYDDLPDPKSKPVEAVMRSGNSYEVNTGSEWKKITEFKPADQKRILAKYGIKVGV